MNMKRFRLVMRLLKIIGGLTAISYAIYAGTDKFFLGVIPFVAGVLNFSPICFVTNKCENK